MGRMWIGLGAFAVAACSQTATVNEGNGAAANSAGAAATNETGPANATAAAPAQQGGVDDPRAFVEERYRAYQASGDGPPQVPSTLYSDRLKALSDAYDRWQNQHQGDVGSIDFDWWINAQDWELRDVRVTAADTGPDARTVTSHFRNIDRQEEVRFMFVRRDGRWYLDDAVQGSGHGDNGWTLSELLRNPE